MRFLAASFLVGVLGIGGCAATPAPPLTDQQLAQRYEDITSAMVTEGLTVLVGQNASRKAQMIKDAIAIDGFVRQAYLLLSGNGSMNAVTGAVASQTLMQLKAQIPASIAGYVGPAVDLILASATLPPIPSTALSSRAVGVACGSLKGISEGLENFLSNNGQTVPGALPPPVAPPAPVPAPVPPPAPVPAPPK